MILVIMRMKVRPEKRLELSQAIVSLIDSIRTQKGCRSCEFSQSLENENELCLIEEWDTVENFKAYLESEVFKVIRGAMNLLEELCDWKLHTVFDSERDDGALLAEFSTEGMNFPFVKDGPGEIFQ